jgi:hypothetical protein
MRQHVEPDYHKRTQWERTRRMIRLVDDIDEALRAFGVLCQIEMRVLWGKAFLRNLPHGQCDFVVTIAMAHNQSRDEIRALAQQLAAEIALPPPIVGLSAWRILGRLWGAA